MTKFSYSNEKLFEIGKTNYEKLISYCEKLDISGFWDKARQVMMQDTCQVLDFYVQTVLMQLARQCDEILESQMEFVEKITNTNPYNINAETELDSDLIRDVSRAYNMPPILIQLSSLYDKENDTNITLYFIDALLNILQCMAYLNHDRNPVVTDFITEYYQKVNYYVLNKSEKFHTNFIVHKINNNYIICDVDEIEKEAKLRENTKIEKMQSSGNAVIENDNQSDDLVDFQEKRENLLREQEEKRAEREKLREENRKIRQDREEELRLQAEEKFKEVKLRIKEREQAEAREQELRLQALVEELNSLVGLESVKTEIQSLINLIKVRKMRASMNLPEMEMSYHMVFTGSPGTGKTTVARLVAKIYKELGILSEGNFVETDRSGLVAGYVGQTAIKVHELVEQAIGGILFIDEAYSLTNPDVPNDFGAEAVDALVKLMEDHRDDLVIIVAGYTEEMQNFLKSNTGLISRFNKFIDFPDYSKEELVEIMDSMGQNAGLIIDDEAKKKVLECLKNKSEDEWKDFGNARGIRNLFEKLVMNQANRLVLLEEPTKIDLITIKKDDVLI